MIKKLKDDKNDKIIKPKMNVCGNCWHEDNGMGYVVYYCDIDEKHAPMINVCRFSPSRWEIEKLVKT